MTPSPKSPRSLSQVAKVTVGALALAGLASSIGCKADAVQAKPTDIITSNPSTLNVNSSNYGTDAEKGHPFYEADGTGQLLMVDFIVMDSTGSPRGGIKVEVTVDFDGIALIPEEAVRTVDQPELPDNINNRSDIEQACTDEDGNFTNEEDWCAWFYDVGTDVFIDFGNEIAFDGYMPSYATLSTDEDGFARVYAFLDRLPSNDGSFILPAATITGSTGYKSAPVPVTLN